MASECDLGYPVLFLEPKGPIMSAVQQVYHPVAKIFGKALGPGASRQAGGVKGHYRKLATAGADASLCQPIRAFAVPSRPPRRRGVSERRLTLPLGMPNHPNGKGSLGPFLTISVSK